jgi:hypothetical protein
MLVAVMRAGMSEPRHMLTQEWGGHTRPWR